MGSLLELEEGLVEGRVVGLGDLDLDLVLEQVALGEGGGPVGPVLWLLGLLRLLGLNRPEGGGQLGPVSLDLGLGEGGRRAGHVVGKGGGRRAGVDGVDGGGGGGGGGGPWDLSCRRRRLVLRVVGLLMWPLLAGGGGVGGGAGEWIVVGGVGEALGDEDLPLAGGGSVDGSVGGKVAGGEVAVLGDSHGVDDGWVVGVVGFVSFKEM